MKITALLSIIAQLPAYSDLLTQLKQGKNVPALSLPSAVRPPLLAQLALDWEKPILFLTPRADTIQVWLQDLQAWLPDNQQPQRFLEPTPLPFERGPWSKRCRQQRATILTQLNHLNNPFGKEQKEESISLLIASTRALIQKTLPRQRFNANTRTYRVGQLLDIEKTQQQWTHMGYEPVPVVEEAGQFSHRGGIIDIYPIDAPYALRIELFGDEIDTMRYFNPATQRSTDIPDSVRQRITIPPAREGMPGEMQPLGLVWAEDAPPKKDDLPAWQDDIEALNAGNNHPHLEYYLPLVYNRAETIIDYLPQDALIIINDWPAFEESVAHQHQQADQLAEEQISLPPSYNTPLVAWDDLVAKLTYRQVLILGEGADIPNAPEPTNHLTDNFQPGPRYGGQTKPFLNQIGYARKQKERTVIVSRQAQRLVEMWQQEENKSQGGSVIVPQKSLYPVETDLLELPNKPITFVQGSLSEGFIVESWVNQTESTSQPTNRLLLNLLTDAELFGWNRPAPRRRQKARTSAPETYFSDLEAGDFIVHLEHGIGRFKGLVTRAIGGNQREYLQVEYANGDTLYVPVHHADRLSKWIGSEERPPVLNRVGNKKWSETKARAQRAVDEMADELIELYSARSTIAGHAFAPDDEWQVELEASFPYQETDDQLKAIAEVKVDMEKPHPMDRLICGDVGYGKTEVALRAAFKAVNDGKQVAILVPTTILAQQHYNTFRERLRSFPIKVRMLSRFRTPAQQRKTTKGLRDGEVDIVIGTHRLLSDDVSFKDLGLLVIDEEQRFGVRHKETLKQLRTEVDVLTMTATPIPRTMHMGLAGVRDISVIATAPAERLPVQTYVGEFDEVLLKRAILREIDRNGQVFLVHNRVQTIDIVLKQIERLVPEARLAVGHGQMSERQLERIMDGFAEGKVDILISTTIVESGLDFPNANTLIVDRAERFGLSQLHQLRGRVGRGVNRAYAYFFHAPWRQLTGEAQQRLETISEESHLGAGYQIAMRDMEIRGVGDLLGSQQSGHIAEIGFDLYTKMLAKSVKKKKAVQQGEDLPADLPEVTLIDLPLPTYIPEDYVPDAGLRLRLYRRMAGLETMSDIEEMTEELTDRFGAIPDPVDNLLYQLRIKALAGKAAVGAVTTEVGQIKLRMPQLEEMNRMAVQRYLGKELRVSRKAIWLPKDLPTREWQVLLVQILEKLPAFATELENRLIREES